MKITGAWLLLLGFLVSCPAWALTCHPKDESPQVSYDEADAVALVRLISETRDNEFSGDFEVIRAWKAALPKRIRIMEPPSMRGMRSIGTCSYHFRHDGRYILYLAREEDGTFSTGYSPLNLHESEDGYPESGGRVFHYRLRELENAARCGCGYEKGSFDNEYLRKRADVIVEAAVTRTWKKGAASYAELGVISREKEYHDPSFEKMPSLIVVTEDGDPDCGYPVTVEPVVERDFLDTGMIITTSFSHRLYLHYSRDTEKKHLITGYSTNICSGNAPVTIRSGPHMRLLRTR